MNDLLLADLVGLLHAVFVIFVVGGLGLILLGWSWGWGWTRGMVFRCLHLAAIGFVVLESWFGIPCPLTVVEAELRGISREITFIGYWLERLLYYQAPGWVFVSVYSLFGGIVILTFVFYPPKR